MPNLHSLQLFLLPHTEALSRSSAHVHRNDDRLVSLTAVASEFIRLWTTSGHASKQYLVVFTSSPTSQTTTNTTIVLVFGSEDANVKEVGEILKLELGVKGGGIVPRRNHG